jgi:hypothetical protein
VAANDCVWLDVFVKMMLDVNSPAKVMVTKFSGAGKPAGGVGTVKGAFIKSVG